MKITPRLEFNKYQLGVAIGFVRTNESKMFIRKYKTISYFIGIVFLWFMVGVEIELEGGNNE